MRMPGNLARLLLADMQYLAAVSLLAMSAGLGTSVPARVTLG